MLSGNGSASSGLEGYIQTVENIVPFEADEELRQLERLQGEGRAEAIRLLVLHHLRLVVAIACDYLRYQQPFSDLIEEGNMALIRAVSQFDPQSGERLVSALGYQISTAISEFVLNNWSIVRPGVTKEQCRLFTRMRTLRRGARKMTAIEIKAVAARLGVRQDDVLRLEERLSAVDIPFGAGAEGVRHRDLADSCGGTVDDEALLSVEEAQWTQRSERQLRQALAQLDERAKDIVERRWLNSKKKARLKDLASEYHVSGERIRQIQQQAFDTIREHLP
jgi:RNA polymerase sigma-32 factor